MSESSSRQTPENFDVDLRDLTLIVRPPGEPIRCFADGRRADAELYAAENDAAVETLPLDPPSFWHW